MVAFCILVITSCFLVGCNGGAALQLLRFDPETKGYQLNETALHAIEVLPEPIYVLAAVGDARIGKSTFLNMLHLNWVDSYTPIDPVPPFKTGSTSDPCTRGVWILTRRLKHGSMVFVDVEGADLGNDAVTKQLSAFTAIMSSYILLFVKEMVNNAGLQFLYHTVELGKMFPDSASSFPSLGVAIRDPLNLSPSFGSRQSSVVYDITVPTHDDGNDKMREKIASVFPPNKIAAFEVEYQNRGQLQDLQTLQSGPYYESVVKIISDLKLNVETKKTPLHGMEMCGGSLVKIIKELFDALKSGNIAVLETAFDQLEKQMCDEHYKKFIQPLINMNEDEFLNNSQQNLNDYVSQCKVESYVKRVKQQVETKQDGIARMREERKERIKAEEAKEEAEEEKIKAQKAKEKADKDKMEAERLKSDAEKTLLLETEKRKEIEHQADLDRVKSELQQMHAAEVQTELQKRIDQALEDQQLTRRELQDLQRQLANINTGGNGGLCIIL